MEIWIELTSYADRFLCLPTFTFDAIYREIHEYLSRIAIFPLDAFAKVQIYPEFDEDSKFLSFSNLSYLCFSVMLAKYFADTASVFSREVRVRRNAESRLTLDIPFTRGAIDLAYYY